MKTILCLIGLSFSQGIFAQQVLTGEIKGKQVLSSGEYEVSGRLSVPPGAELIIPANVSLLFHPGAEIRVEGKLEMRGEAGKPIRVSSLLKEEPGKGISTGTLSENFQISHAEFTHLTQPVFIKPGWNCQLIRIDSCVFDQNTSGLSVVSIGQPAVGYDQPGIIRFRYNLVSNGASGVEFLLIDNERITLDCRNNSILYNYFSQRSTNQFTSPLTFAGDYSGDELIQLENNLISRNFTWNPLNSDTLMSEVLPLFLLKTPHFKRSKNFTGTFRPQLESGLTLNDLALTSYIPHLVYGDLTPDDLKGLVPSDLIKATLNGTEVLPHEIDTLTPDDLLQIQFGFEIHGLSEEVEWLTDSNEVVLSANTLIQPNVLQSEFENVTSFTGFGTVHLTHVFESKTQRPVAFRLFNAKQARKMIDPEWAQQYGDFKGNDPLATGTYGFDLQRDTSGLLSINKRKTSQSLALGTGIPYYMGDLAKNYRFINILSIRPSINLSYEYSFLNNFGIKGMIGYSYLNGDDDVNYNSSTTPDNAERKLSFRAHVVDINLLALWGFHWGRSFRNRIMAGAGIGAFYFKNLGEYNGQWYELRLLGTQGQTVNGGKPYSPFAFSTPVQLNYRRLLRNGHAINISWTHCKTFTDNLDDVSPSDYPDPALLRAANPKNPDAAVFLSNPGNAHGKRSIGSGKDAYGVLGISYAIFF